jgi:hypothetical protein
MPLDQQFLEFVIKALVDNPNDVKITRTVDEMGVLLTLDIGAADMGKIIGRQGNTAKSIRTLLRVVGMKNNSRVNLKINEPVGGLRSPEHLAAASAAASAAGAPMPAGTTVEDAEEAAYVPTSAPVPRVQSASKTVDEAMADLKLG